MIWTITSAVALAGLGLFIGYKRFFRLYHITAQRIGIFSIVALSMYSILLYLFKIEVMSEAIGGLIITGVYALVAGFFLGMATSQYQMRRAAGTITYVHRGFLADYAPAIIALALILFGVMRTSIFSFFPVTPIRLSSGLSFIAMGIWGMTLRPVPEFRIKGIVILDNLVPWKDFVSYTWYLENVLEVEYKLNGTLHNFRTSVPEEDRPTIEKLLHTKMLEKMETKKE